MSRYPLGPVGVVGGTEPVLTEESHGLVETFVPDKQDALPSQSLELLVALI